MVMHFPEPAATPCAHSSASEVKGHAKITKNGEWRQAWYEACGECVYVVDTFDHGGIDIEGGISVNGSSACAEMMQR